MLQSNKVIEKNVLLYIYVIGGVVIKQTQNFQIMSEMRGVQTKTKKMSEIQMETFETKWGVSISKFKLCKNKHKICA